MDRRLLSWSLKGTPEFFTPARAIVLVGVAIFIAEASVMRILAVTGRLGDPHVHFLDAGIVLGLLLPPLGFAYIVLVRKERARRLHEQQLRDYCRQIVTATDGERRRIAMNLHDESGQVLAALQIGLQALQRSLPQGGDLAEQCHRLTELVGRLGASLRAHSEQSFPSDMLNSGITSALQAQTQRFAQQFPDLRISFEATGPDEGVPDDVRLAIYRVCQEALTNVARHAAAGSVRVRLENDGRHVRLSVEDDGRGLDVTRAIEREGGRLRLGIIGMRERLLALGGTLSIESLPGSGTKVRADAPLGGRGSR